MVTCTRKLPLPMNCEVAFGHAMVTRCVSEAAAMQQRIDGGLLMGDGACTVAPSLTLRVTSVRLHVRVNDGVWWPLATQW